jgi:hypothetical protein
MTKNVMLEISLFQPSSGNMYMFMPDQQRLKVGS